MNKKSASWKSVFFFLSLWWHWSFSLPTHFVYDHLKKTNFYNYFMPVEITNEKKKLNRCRYINSSLLQIRVDGRSIISSWTSWHCVVKNHFICLCFTLWRLLFWLKKILFFKKRTCMQKLIHRETRKYSICVLWIVFRSNIQHILTGIFFFFR